MKHHLDYPDYNKTDAENTRFWPTNKDKQLPEPKMNYVIELLSNDKDSFEALVEISRLMQLNEVELL